MRYQYHALTLDIEGRTDFSIQINKLMADLAPEGWELLSMAPISFKSRSHGAAGGTGDVSLLDVMILQVVLRREVSGLPLYRDPVEDARGASA